MDSELKIIIAATVIFALVAFAFLLPRMLRHQSWKDLTPEQQQAEMEKIQTRKRRWLWIETGIQAVAGALLVGFASALNIWNSEETTRQCWMLCGLIAAGEIGSIIFGCTRK